MTVPAQLREVPDVRGAVTTDRAGEIADAAGSGPSSAHARAAAAAVTSLSDAGGTLGLTRLELVFVRCAKSSLLAAVRPHDLLIAQVDAPGSAPQVEKALQAWATSDAPPARPPPARGASAPGDDAPPAARPALDAEQPPEGAKVTPPALPRPPPQPSASAPAGAASAAPSDAPAEAPSAQAPARADPWAELRRALVRGQLTEAASLARGMADGAPDGAPAVGAEPVPRAERDQAVQTLVEGIGSVLAGDCIAAGRVLREVAAAAQKNLSLRWVALHWGARAALRCGNLAVARSDAKEALVIAQQLDLTARAVSHWSASEVLAEQGDHRRALALLHDARIRFERIADAWGVGQTWLAEARLMAALQRDAQATEAARQAQAAQPTWDEPGVFLARRALIRGELGEVEALLRTIETAAAERVRALVDAVRQGVVSLEDVGAFLRECDAAPTQGSIRTLERIARSAPGFVQAREALAWALLKLGRYADASTLLRALLAQPLAPPVRASVMLGLGCVENAQQATRGRDTGPPAASPQGAAPAQDEGASAPLPQVSSSAIPSKVSQAGTLVFSGELNVFPLPDVLEFVRSSRRTGALVCTSAAGMGTLRFVDGAITAAVSPGAPALGQLLVDAHKLSSLAALAGIPDVGQDAPDAVLGGLLVREGLVDAPAVQDALRRKIELVLRELLEWKAGDFAFTREGADQPDPAGISVALDPQGVLLNVFKELDEGSRAAREVEG